MKPSDRVLNTEDDMSEIIEILDEHDSRLSALESKSAVTATEAVARDIVEAIWSNYEDRRGFGLESLPSTDPYVYSRLLSEQTRLVSAILERHAKGA